ncbi:MAG: hypothetical protein V1779_13160 [bacterium]
MEDKSRFGRSNIFSRNWTPKGIRAEIVKQIVRQYTYAYASVCFETGESHSFVLSISNTKIMNNNLDDLAKVYSHYRILLCSDIESWYAGSVIVIPKNIFFISTSIFSH